MKTKRIVALALAGVLAAGAVAPVYAAESYKEFTSASTSEAYNVIRQAQWETVQDLRKKSNDLRVKTQEALNALKAAKDDVIVKQAAVDLAQANYDEQNKRVASVTEHEIKVKTAKDKAEIELGSLYRLKSTDNIEDQVAAADAKVKNVEKQIDAVIEAAMKDNEWSKDGLEKNFYEGEEFHSKEGKNLDYYKNAAKELHEKYVAANKELSNLQEAYDWWKKNVQDLELEATEAAHIIKEEKDVLLSLQTKLDDVNYDLIAAKDAEKAAQKNYVTLLTQADAAKNQLVIEEDKYQRIETLLKKITHNVIENETDPALIELATKDPMAYLLGKLVEDDLFLSKETLDNLGLTETTLKLYQDLLADQTDLEEPDEPTLEEPQSEEPQSEEPTTEAPTTEAPTTEAPEPEKPAASDKTEDKTPNADKKDKKANKDKKAAPKTGDISVLAYAGSAVLAAGAFVASKKRK
ncbi:MAG: hypothetical protein PUJ57_00795 [Peptoniphilaceae bacterium]|nr:hypothetical protein [Peptoniphilaceae bacterium]